MEKRRNRAGIVLFAILTCTILGASPASAFDPFPTCLETSRVDSIQKTYWADSSMAPGGVPSIWWTHYQYEGSTCRLKQSAEKKTGSLGLVIKYTPRPEPRVSDYAYYSESGEVLAFTGTVWYSPEWKTDSMTSVYFQKNADLKTIKIFLKVLYERHPGYEVTRYLIGKGEEPVKTLLTDSIVFGNPESVIFMKGDSGRAVIRCAAEAQTYVCKVTEMVGERGFSSKKNVWHLTGGRMDSVVSYDTLGAPMSKIRYFWSASTASLLPRPRPRLSGFDRKWGIFDLTGRRFRP